MLRVWDSFITLHLIKLFALISSLSHWKQKQYVENVCVWVCIVCVCVRVCVCACACVCVLAYMYTVQVSLHTVNFLESFDVFILIIYVWELWEDKILWIMLINTCQFNFPTCTCVQTNMCLLYVCIFVCLSVYFYGTIKGLSIQKDKTWFHILVTYGSISTLLKT